MRRRRPPDLYRRQRRGRDAAGCRSEGRRPIRRPAGDCRRRAGRPGPNLAGLPAPCPPCLLGQPGGSHGRPGGCLGACPTARPGPVGGQAGPRRDPRGRPGGQRAPGRGQPIVGGRRRENQGRAGPGDGGAADSVRLSPGAGGRLHRPGQAGRPLHSAGQTRTGRLTKAEGHGPSCPRQSRSPRPEHRRGRPSGRRFGPVARRRRSRGFFVWRQWRCLACGWAGCPVGDAGCGQVSVGCRLCSRL